jgi:hypothetical protein
VGAVNAVVSDAAGNLYIAGLVREALPGPSYAAIMKSSDGGQTWDSDPSTPDVDDPSDAFSGTGSRPTIYFGMAAARVGNGAGGFTDHLVAVGLGSRPVTNQLGAFNSNVFIRRSLDSGATWQTLDEYEHPTYETLSHPRVVALDSQGNIYTVVEALEHLVTTKGKTTTTKRVEHWLIRKGTNNTDGTMSWATIDLSFPNTVSSVYGVMPPRGIACVGDGVYIVGGGGVYGDDWLVIKSGDGGVNWTTADSYRLDASGPSEAHAISADSAGNLYVAGTASKTVTTGKGNNATRTTTNYWIVRKAAPGGTGWQTVDTFTLPGGYATPNSVAVDPLDNVHVCGQGRVGSLPTQWITRKGSGGVWTTTDTFSYANDGGGTFAYSICADPHGNVFAAGGSSDFTTSNYRNWLVRRQFAP